MSHPRLSLALEGGGLNLSDGRIGVFAARSDTDLSDLPQAQCQIVTGFKPDFDRLSGQGFDCTITPEGRYAVSIVFLPRAKRLARALIARAVALTDGAVVIDGQKTDGVDSALKEIRKRIDVQSVISKAHGKLFWFTGSVDLSDWDAPETVEIEGGFVTAPGVFSADGIDPASDLLAAALPQKLSGDWADLGAGWGYLSRAVLQRPAVKTLSLVEADHASLDCARINIEDERATFHWADATTWRADRRLNGIVMNPPFHTGRAADPELGRTFIAAAARNLSPQGELWMVANRHLPYETALAGFFTDVKEAAGDNRFKVLHAKRPSRQKR
ncbi:Ribosomal RNA large subunit methyltransferase G [Thalassovita gelatinovora]|uniref:Ribosomal RNA large subunit methyltransferase G n=1 Tax=Thalassovita gelatinovora TaxID=53501 RepID=A0A0P1FL43_THAGE|nr:class I SAM-dependent methyltransferase [Thalassovita gelatinovora]QIZ81666.1 class I SAM-dependent methyltransferase [Thalassovita gelatinovora]CUH68177.1 Ribosomal RNA large subunit methyltransferase G [Thalassovita gelatinovora]SEQ30633.1 16S rRNA m(2)G 1207 methyltransferase [Thalassovita gelatinovora]